MNINEYTIKKIENANIKHVLLDAIKEAALDVDESGVSQLEKTINQRLPGKDNAGSDIGELTPEEFVFSVINLIEKGMITDTSEKYHESGDVRPWCSSFELMIPGNCGVISIDNLPENTTLYIAKTHGDSLCVVADGIKKEAVGNTHFIIGAKSPEDNTQELYTFFAGSMTPAYEFENGSFEGKEFFEGQTITIEEAKQMKVTSVKYGSPEIIQKLKDAVPLSKLIEKNEEKTENTSADVINKDTEIDEI